MKETLYSMNDLSSEKRKHLKKNTLTYECSKTLDANMLKFGL